MNQPFDYKRYLASREWAIRKRAVIERADDGQTCERCGASHPEPGGKIVAAVHHRTYAHIGHERLEDLLGVCEGCHRWLSGFSDVDPLVVLLRGEAEASGDPHLNDSILAVLQRHPDWTANELYLAEMDGGA